MKSYVYFVIDIFILKWIHPEIRNFSKNKVKYDALTRVNCEKKTRLLFE